MTPDQAAERASVTPVATTVRAYIAVRSDGAAYVCGCHQEGEDAEREHHSTLDETMADWSEDGVVDYRVVPVVLQVRGDRVEVVA